MYVKNYDFRINGEAVGEFELSEQPGWIHRNATFTVDGQKQENPFAVRLEHNVPIAVRTPAGEWLDVEAGVYPSAAWPLVLRAGLTEYDCLDEGTRQVVRCEIRLEDGLHTEYRDAERGRRFKVEDLHVTYIRWGDSAESFLL